MPGYNVFGDGMFFGEGMLKDVMAPVSCCVCLCLHPGCCMCAGSAETLCRHGPAFRLMPRPSDLSLSAPCLGRLCRDLRKRLRLLCGVPQGRSCHKRNFGPPLATLPPWSDSELSRNFRCVVIQLWSFHHVDWAASTGVGAEPRVRQLGQPPPHRVRRDRCRLEGSQEGGENEGALERRHIPVRRRRGHRQVKYPRPDAFFDASESVPRTMRRTLRTTSARRLRQTSTVLIGWRHS
jgi:hypothetical protein